MAFKHAEFNITEQVEEKGIINLVTGRRNTVFLRNKYQTELDNANASVVDMVHYCEEKSKELKEAFNKAQGIKASIEAHEVERANAYEALGNLLNKETNFEKEMHKDTTKMYGEVSKNQQSKSVNVRQRLKDSDVNEMRFSSMIKYIDKYPEYQSKSSFKKILDKIEEKEREIRHAKIDSNKAVSAYHDHLQTFKIYIQKAKDKIKIYHNLLEEGQKKIDETRYHKGIFYKLASERKKNEVNLDTIKHRMAQFENTLEIIEKELSNYEGRKFVEVEY